MKYQVNALSLESSIHYTAGGHLYNHEGNSVCWSVEKVQPVRSHRTREDTVVMSGKFLFIFLLLISLSSSSADSQSRCDILIGRLDGPGSDPVSETVLQWIREVAEDSCGLRVQLYDDAISDENFIDFNSIAIERGACAMLTGSCDVDGDSVMIDMVIDQIFTNPYLIEDRKHFSRPDESIVLNAELLGSTSPPPGSMMFYGYLLSAFAHGRQGLYDTALEEVNLALQNSSGVPPEAVAEAYLFRSQLVSMTGTNYAAGIPDLDSALEMDPGCIRARLAMGYIYELGGDPQAALEQYDLAVETAPSMYKCRKVRANLYSRLDMFQESVADYTMAVQLNPDDFESWHYGGVDLRRTRDFQTAYEWLTRALELEQEAAQVWYDRALVNAISEADMEKATEDMERALELDGTDWKWYDTAATIWIVRDDWERCIEMANRGLEVSPMEPQLLIDRSVGHMMLENIDTALADLEAAVEEGNSRRDINFRDETYIMLEALRAVSEMSPDSAMYWLYLGYAIGENGFYEEAIGPLTNAILISPSLRDAYWLRASNLAETGHIDQALEDLYKALEMTDDPTERADLQEAIELLEE